MIRKRSGFFHRVRRLLKRIQPRTHRLGTLLLLLTLFFGAAVLPPSFAYMAGENSIVQTLPDAQALEQQGRELYEAEQFSEAARLWQQAIAAFKATGDNLRQAMTLSNLSLAYQQLGQWQEAEQAIRDAIALLNIQNPNTSPAQAQILAQALDVQGRLQLARGHAEPALTTWRQAADIYAQLGDEAALTRNRINQTQALQALGLYRQAQRTLAEVNQTLQNASDSSLKATGLRSLGNTLRVIGDLSESRQVLEQSLAVARALQDPHAISEALLSLGNTARTQQETQAALDYYRQADATATSPTTQIQAQLNQLSLLLEDEQLSAVQALWTKILSQISTLPPSRTAVYAQINFAESLIRLKQQTTTDTPSWQEIVQLLTVALEQAKNLEDPRATSYALGHLGELYEQTQEWSEAHKFTQQALFIAQAIDASDIAYQWQWQLGRLLKERGDIEGAIAAYTEAHNNLQSLRSDLVAINPDVQFSFREEVEPVYRQLVDLLLQSPPTSSYQGVSQQNLQQARKVIESLQLAELDNFFREACLEARVEIDNVVDQAKSAAVIYPIILEQGLEIIVKLPGQEELRHYTATVAQDKVEGIVADLREYLLDVTRTAQVKQQSQQIYDWLIRPAEAELANSGIKTLVFVLDGSLRNIPMAVLYDQQQKKYLVEKYAISLTPGLQLIDPKPLQQVQLNALTAGVSEKRRVEGREFSSLENVERELERIQSEVPKSKELFNQEFTQTNLQTQLQSAPFSVVHLATHGEFSSNPEETFILTWDQLLKVRNFDNLLRLSDQSGSGTIELLVLSACKTAQGDKRAALGLAGVAVRAGARSTLATLWSVDDASTAELMSQFYRELNSGVTKAEALQHAQLAVLNHEQRPYFWAPYVLVGNWL